MLSQIIAQTTTHQPVPVHFLTWENVALFLRFTWLINRAIWPVWVFLAVCAIAKVMVKVGRRTR